MNTGVILIEMVAFAAIFTAIIFKSCTDSANGRATAAPRRLNRGAAPMLLYPLFGYRII